MAGNDLSVGPGDAQTGFHRINKPVDRPATGDINVGEETRKKCIAHMQHIRALEIDDRITIGMSRRHVHRPDRVTIHVKMDVIAKCQDWQKPVRVLRVGIGQPRADIVVGDDSCAFGVEVIIRTRMIAVIVSVEDKTWHALARNIGNSRFDLRPGIGQKVVHQQDAVCARQKRHIAAGSGRQHDNAAA